MAGNSTHGTPGGSGRAAPDHRSQPGEPTTAYVRVPLTVTAPSPQPAQPTWPSQSATAPEFPPPAESTTPLWPGRTPGRAADRWKDSKLYRPGWILALRVASAVLTGISLIGGIVAFIQVSAITAAWYYYSMMISAFYSPEAASPNTALALLAMIACWVVGGCASIALMVVANMAEDTAEVKAMLAAGPAVQP